MPRRPRVDLAGFHHVVNRGSNRKMVFKQEADYETFLKIVCKAAKTYKVTIHDYCLMSNHYHLLIETRSSNLSLFMKQINSNYAIYANKKYNWSGHFWQGRFYSRYITSEEYFYTLIKYIEQNPIEAKIVSDIKDYPYTLGSVIANKKEPIPCALESKLLKELKYENLQDIIGVKLSEEDLESLEKIKKEKVAIKNKKAVSLKQKSLKEHFANCSSKSLRNSAIKEALEDGYTQSEIAKFLKLSNSAVSKIVKKLQK